MYEVPADGDQPEAMLSVNETTRSTEEIVSFTLPAGAPPVRFGLAGELSPHRGSVSKRVLSLPGGKDVPLFAVDLQAENGKGGSFRGSWESPKPTEPRPSEMGYGGFGAIEDLPRELRSKIMGLLSPLRAEPMDSSELIELAENLLIGSWIYQEPQIEKRPIQDGSSFVLIDGVNGSERVILRSVEGLGNEYLIPFGPLESEEIEASLIDSGLVEAAGHSWKGQPVLVAQGALQELTGFGFSYGADPEQ